MNNTNKIKFKKENDKPTFRDSIIFIMIVILCIVTMVTIQLRSQQKKETDTLNSQRVSNDEEVTPVSEEADIRDDAVSEAEMMKESVDLQTSAAAHRDIINENENTDVVDNTDKSEEQQTMPVPVPLEFVPPAKGNVTKKYSASELIYSHTLDDWRIHLGMDISSPVGSQVSACEKGIVEEIYEDEEYGVTVKLRHNDRYVTGYSNLSGNLEVTVGQHVEKGQKIGVVGDSAMYEVLDEAHLHFSMSEDGVMVNPEKFIKF